MPKANDGNFPSCEISNCYNYVKDFASIKPNLVAILYFLRVRDKETDSVVSISTFGGLS